MNTADVAWRASLACHDLLVALAGRLPDELLWRLRDWLAADASAAPALRTAAHDTVSLMLPRELIHHRVGLTDRERDLLSDAAGGWGSARRLLDAMLPAHVPGEPVTYAFVPEAAATDAAALSVLAVVRSHPGSTQLSLARRTGLRGTQRVVLIRGGDRPWMLTAVLQRLLRAHGDRTPCVEVLTDRNEPSPYHDSAAAVALAVWRATDAGALLGASA